MKTTWNIYDQMEVTNVELTRRKVEQGGFDWIYLTQDMKKCRIVANPATELQTAYRAESVQPSR